MIDEINIIEAEANYGLARCNRFNVMSPMKLGIAKTLTNNGSL